MPKVFISHSSNDKEHYVDKVVYTLKNIIGEKSIEYDALSFEAGNKSIEEINRAMEVTDLFVIFLSDAALNSKWVQLELYNAEKLMSIDKIKRVYPIIIDSKIKYDDNRIPDWLKEYNIKYIKRPNKSAKLIVERMKNLSWEMHPEFSKIKTIFVGRNNLINDFEKRIDDYDKENVTTIIASGLNKIGRKSLIRHCLKKASIINNYYSFPVINLKYNESIEDFIIKINDLGFNDEFDASNLLKKDVTQKIKCALEIIKEIQEVDEIITIQDNGCIVDYSGKISSWFKRIIYSLENNNKITFVIISRFKCLYSDINSLNGVFYTQVPELSKSECVGLLRRTLDVYGIVIEREQMNMVSSLLTGYPLQVLYASEIIKEFGIGYLLDKTYLLSDFNYREMSTLLSEFEGNEEATELLALIAKFGSISFETLYSILDREIYQKVLDRFFALSICEYEGVDKEYLRLNEVVKDYIGRTDADISDETREKITECANQILLDGSRYNLYTPEFYFILKEKLISDSTDTTLYAKYIIPSVYFKGMIDLYEKGTSYKSVVNLADKAIENQFFTDSRIMSEIRYLLCTALAKLQDSRFLEEVSKIDGINHLFLKAFYYRQIGKNDKALEYLNKCDRCNPNYSKAQRERVLVYKNLQEFDLAMELSKNNYINYPNNPYHIQAYFDCLTKTNKVENKEVILDELLKALLKIKSKKAKSMYARCYALYLAFVEHDELAFSIIDKAIIDYPNDKKYAYVVKSEIADIFDNIKIMEDVIGELKKGKYNTNTITIIQSKIIAKRGNVEGAITHFKTHIKNFTSTAIDSFCNNLNRYKSGDNFYECKFY